MRAARATACQKGLGAARQARGAQLGDGVAHEGLIRPGRRRASR
jgi:hypothetical protein